jgi:hypothetical protein
LHGASPIVGGNAEIVGADAATVKPWYCNEKCERFLMTSSDGWNRRVEQLRAMGGRTDFFEDLARFDGATTALAAQSQRLAQFAIIGQTSGYGIADLRIGDAFAKTDVHKKCSSKYEGDLAKVI